MKKKFIYAVFGALMAPYIAAFTIVLDPGHGGKFTGGIGCNNLEEKECTLTCARKLAELLKKENTVMLTRTTDTQFHDDLLEDLRIRADYSRKYSADLFISLHYNTGGKHTRGFEIYVPYGSKFPAGSYAAAAAIHHELTQVVEPHWSGTLGNFNDYDRGIRAGRFHVLRNHKCPALLIEIDYISNQESVALLKNTVYQEKLVQALARAIAQFKKDNFRNR